MYYVIYVIVSGKKDLNKGTIVIDDRIINLSEGGLYSSKLFYVQLLLWYSCIRTRGEVFNSAKPIT